ncbi:PopZ family protein [Roseibium sp. RKSG952]|uniref:PopZ family protein n=1 Tax=Roseibium sp. RKSG952 TaxID=2529384 RepID=UPI0012BC3474|nr:DUF2497 domain-containing protein [Roseibium sp. RKSG952]MTH97998.1 DUF2497 domain-containing protein [Roseibium sp. RKSG952]
MARANRADEPSMEEILASIRRIIADEEAPATGAGAVAAQGHAVKNIEEVGASEDMGNSTEMSQEDLDKLFDMDGDDVVDDPDEMAADAVRDQISGDDDILELTEDQAVSDKGSGHPVESSSSQDGDGDVFDEDETGYGAGEPASHGITPEPEDDLPRVSDEEPLTSVATGQAVHAAIDNLSHMFVGSQAQTLEDLVRDMLRPMLKAWLDQNLPPMVEDMVKKEIQRVTRRR